MTKQRAFTKEFEEEAVRLARTNGRMIRETAENLGIGLSTLTRWLSRRFVHPGPRFAQSMGFTSIPQVTIPAGEKRDINTVVLIPLAITNPSEGAEANQFSFELAYDSGTGERGEQLNVNEGIVFAIINPPDAKWSVVENCKELSFK